MELNKKLMQLPQLLKQYRYPLVIVLIGFVLMTLPLGKKAQDSALPTQVQQAEIQDEGQKLANILGQISGVGRVEVMLTIAQSEKTIYNTDEQVSSSDSSSSIRKETVIITDSSHGQHALITQVVQPVYRGAIIVCQGGDEPNVKLAIVEAVSKATGLGASQISVLKMK